ncbi:MAG: FtsW/RodA/SpoVE family cell cycle protein [Agathobacter sp.]|nr:FtsW/RodA/SpoVE family cell cycle protein [Agathobacter sp.]
MASIIIQVSKYIILFLFLGYIFGAFYVFRYGKQPEKQKIIYNIQKVFLFAIHGLGYLCLYLQDNNTELVGFYLMQVVLLCIIFMFYHFMYKRCSVLLLNNMCMLLVIGMIMQTRLSFDKAFRQFIFIAIGSVIMLIIPLFLQKGSLFRKFTALYFGVGVTLLAVVVAIGSTSYGAKLTISIGGFSFQPSEFVKILFVFFVAAMLYKGADFKRVLLTSCLSAVYVLLLVASKDLGGALLYFMAYLIMIYVASKKVVYLGAGFAGIAVACVAGYHLFSHVQTRFFVWMNPTADIDNKGYQICQSLFGIGTGGWFGLGIGEGIPKKIPIVDKDFVFSAISEEFGAIFAIGLILLCVSCFVMIIHVSMQMKDKFYKLVAVGLAVLYATQVILTIGGAIKFIPSTGVTLPLVSYGGSSMLSTLIVFGIVQGLYMRKAAAQANEGKRKKEEKKANKKTTKKESDREYHVVTYLFLTIFLAMIAYFVYFLAVESEEFINNEYNGLQTLFEKDVIKGEIITSDGYVIAETVTDEEGNTSRNYPYGSMFAHATGYSSNVRTGLEKQLNFTLLRSHTYFVEQLMCDLTNEKKIGDRVISTLRYDLQEAAYQALGNYDGAVIVMEPSTGKILAMVSKPTYNPNTIEEDWESLQEGSALYNRATQGQYTPGSIFKMMTLLAYMESNPDAYSDYNYECTGEITINNKTIHCASNKAHGIVDLKTSFAKSCNTSFVNMMQNVDEEVMQKLCDSLLFNQDLPIAFESSKSNFALSKVDDYALKMDTAIGQGKTVVSPLHMAMLASAVCNDGIAMRPTMVEKVENYKGILVEETKEKEYKNIFSETQVSILSDYMRETVEAGTASRLFKDAYTAYGKTGTAQTTNDLDETNAWFVGYAEKEGKEIAIAVVVEDSGTGSAYAVPIAEKIFDLYFK